MEYYYTSSNHQDYPLNYPYNNQPYSYNDYHHNYYYSSSTFDESKSDTPGIPLKLNYEFPSYDEYGGYSNEPPIRYDQNYYDNYHTQFHSNPYEHFPAQSLTVYQYNSSYDDHPFEFPAKKGSNFLDPVSTTGFVISYSNTTEPKPDLELEEFDLRNFHGGYSIEETYGKPLPPSEEICYPPSKFDPTPPPPPSAFGEGEKNLNKTPELKEDEHQASEPEEDDDDEEEEEEHEEENGSVLIAPLPRMDDQAVNEEEEEDDDDDEEEENRGVLVAPPLLRKEDQGVNESEDEEEESSNSEGYEEREEEERENMDGGRVEEKEIKRQIPPGYGLQAMDLCEGVFGGYFPCLRKRSNLQGSGDQSNSSNSNTIGSANNEFFSGDCWNTTVDYLFGDPDPYARALPDPIYGYHRYYPPQPISGVIDSGEDHSWMDNSSYYNYECNGGGY